MKEISLPSPNHHPSTTSSTIITLKSTTKNTVPTLECCPCDIFGISSSTTTYSMAPAKSSRALRYYKLGETPAYYITAWYKLLSGKWEFGKVHATETTVEGVTVELTTNPIDFVDWFKFIQPNASLTMIGLSAPTSTAVLIKHLLFSLAQTVRKSDVCIGFEGWKACR